MSVTLQKVLEDLYGVKSFYHLSDPAFTAGVAVSLCVKNNPNRLSFVVVNLSGNALYISPRNDVSAAQGIYVAPNGGSVQIIWDRDFELVSQAWYMIAAGAASSVFILENISI
ncbi:MAG: hypothetical protein PHI02_09325 [Sulfurovaceae bacterium]|nr:hypothetical protein [Sulfurovaceae bacterium]